MLAGSIATGISIPRQLFFPTLEQLTLYILGTSISKKLGLEVSFYTYKTDSFTDRNIEKKGYINPLILNGSRFVIANPVNRQTLDSILVSEKAEKYLLNLGIKPSKISKLEELSNLLAREYGIRIEKDASEFLKEIVVEKTKNEKPPNRANIILEEKIGNEIIKRVYVGEFDRELNGYIVRVKPKVAELNNIKEQIKRKTYLIPIEKLKDFEIVSRAEDYYPVYILLNILNVYNPIMNGDISEIAEYIKPVKEFLYRIKRELNITMLPTIDLQYIENLLPSSFVVRFFFEDTPENRYRTIQINIPKEIYNNINIKTEEKEDFIESASRIIRTLIR